MTHCPLCEAVTGKLSAPTARYVNTFIDYQGQLLCKPCSNAPDLRLQSNRAILAQPDPADLLTRLIVLYWRDGVSQERAAHLLRMRKETFAELADLRLGMAALERVANGYLMAAFNRQFPECNVPLILAGNRARTPPAKPAKYRRASKSECHLVTPPQRHTMREIVPRQYAPDAEVRAYLKAHPVPLYKRFKDKEIPELELTLST